MLLTSAPEDISTISETTITDTNTAANVSCTDTGLDTMTQTDNTLRTRLIRTHPHTVITNTGQF